MKNKTNLFFLLKTKENRSSPIFYEKQNKPIFLLKTKENRSSPIFFMKL